LSGEGDTGGEVYKEISHANYIFSQCNPVLYLRKEIKNEGAA